MYLVTIYHLPMCIITITLVLASWIKSNGVEGDSRRLLAHVLMERVTAKLIESKAVRQRLGHRLQAKGHANFAQRVPSDSRNRNVRRADDNTSCSASVILLQNMSHARTSVMYVS